MRTLLLALLALPAIVQAAPALSPADATFATVSRAYLDGLAQLNPVEATNLGDHRYDDKLPDLSTTGRTRRVIFDHAILSRLAAVDRAKLTPDDRVDATLLANALNYDLWKLTAKQSWAWDAQIYSSAAGDALYSLAARDFAPWPQRLRAATARMEALPGLLAQARVQLVPARVPAIYAMTVAKQNGGVVEVAQTMLAPHAGELNPAERKRFDAALARLKTEVAAHQRWIDTVLVPAAGGDFRLGAARYDEMVKFALVGAHTRPEIERRARAAFDATRAEMYALARTALDGRADAPPTPANPTPGQQQAAIVAALELSYAKRPTRENLMGEATATLAQATDFVRAKNLLTLPPAPVRIVTMPVFRQGVAVAYCDSPGPLEVSLPTLYAISPIPAAWSDAQATSFLREYNSYMIQDLSIHEAMPGHYVQLGKANAVQSPLRAVLQSGPFVEGWAVYAEGVMMDAGYLDRDPLYRLTVLKMRLRSISNALLDIGIQTEGMTREAAMKLMMEGAFQQEREAAGKWTRASLGAVQLLSYFTGYAEHLDLRAEAERRAGARFDLKAYHDALLSHGSPPTRFVRALMFGEAVPE